MLGILRIFSTEEYYSLVQESYPVVVGLLWLLLPLCGGMGGGRGGGGGGGFVGGAGTELCVAVPCAAALGAELLLYLV